MFMRFATFVCAAAALTAATASAQEAAPARCEETSFRVYFAQDSAALDPAALDTIRAAERQVAGCAYSELHIALDGPQARERGEAIRVALDNRAWDLVRIEPRGMRQVSMGPEYADVMVTPRVVPQTRREAGV